MSKKFEYIAHPATVKGFAAEMIKVLDAYKTGVIGNTEVEGIIRSWADTDREFWIDFESEEGFNPTFLKIIGKRRLKLLKKLMPNGIQSRLI